MSTADERHEGGLSFGAQASVESIEAREWVDRWQARLPEGTNRNQPTIWNYGFLYIFLIFFMLQASYVFFRSFFGAGVVGLGNSPLMALSRHKGKVATYWQAGEKMILSTFNSLVLMHFQMWSIERASIQG